MKMNRLKIRSAAVAVVVTMTVLVTTGCGYGASGGLDRPTPPIPPPAGAVFGTVFDLANHEAFQALAVGAAGNDAVFGDDIPLVGAGAPGALVVASPVAGQDRSLQLTGAADWGDGFDMTRANFGFFAGDTVTIRGYVVTLPAGRRIQVNLSPTGENTFIGGVNAEHNTQGAFEIEFTLTDANMGVMGARGLRFEMRPNAGIVVRIDDIIIRGMREPDFPGFVPGGGEEERVISLAPGQVDGVVAVTGTSGPITLVTLNDAFRELRIGRDDDQHGLDILLGPVAGFTPAVSNLQSEGYTTVGGVYIVRVEGRAADDATGNLELHQVWAGASFEPVTPGAVFITEFTFGELTAEDGNPPDNNRNRARIRGAGSGELILTNVIVMRASDRVPVWTLAYALVDDEGIPTTPVPARPYPASIVITPSTAMVMQGGTLQFSATSAGPPGFVQSVNWNVAPAADATISTGGLLTVNRDSRSPLTVTATFGTTVSNSAVILVGETGPLAPPASITVASVSAQPGAGVQLSATVAPAGAHQGIEWEFVGTPPADANLSATGFLTISADATIGTVFNVRAVSTFEYFLDNEDEVFGAATVTVSEPPEHNWQRVIDLGFAGQWGLPAGSVTVADNGIRVAVRGGNADDAVAVPGIALARLVDPDWTSGNGPFFRITLELTEGTVTAGGGWGVTDNVILSNQNNVGNQWLRVQNPTDTHFYITSVEVATIVDWNNNAEALASLTCVFELLP